MTVEEMVFTICKILGRNPIESVTYLDERPFEDTAYLMTSRYMRYISNRETEHIDEKSRNSLLICDSPRYPTTITFIERPRLTVTWYIDNIDKILNRLDKQGIKMLESDLQWK